MMTLDSTDGISIHSNNNDTKNDDLGGSAAAYPPLNTSAIDTTTGNDESANTAIDTSTKSNNPDDDGTKTTTANTTATTSTSTTTIPIPIVPMLLSKNRKKKLEKLERTKRKKLEKKEREKAHKRAKAISQGRDLDAERKVMEEKTKLGEGRKRSNEIWAKKLIDARTRFEICIDLGGRGRGHGGQCSNDNNNNNKSDDNDDNDNNDNALMLSNFEKVMREREIASLAQQIRYCYSYNKRSPNPVLTAVTGLSKKSAVNSTDSNTNNNDTNNDNLTTVRSVLERESGFGEWNRRLFDCNEQSLEDYYGLEVNDNKGNDNDNKEDTNNDNKDSSDENKEEDKEVRVSSLSKSNMKKIVYLTSDSTTTLSTLNDDTIYVIGGIVDRNRLKYATINRAQKELNISTAKLPLTEYLTSTTPISTTTKSKNEEIRNVPLTVNHVFDIMLKYKQYNNNWERAFQDVLPSRKDKDVPVVKENNNLDDGVVVDVDVDVADNNNKKGNNKNKRNLDNNNSFSSGKDDDVGEDKKRQTRQTK